MFIAYNQSIYSKGLISKGDSLLTAHEFSRANKFYSNFAYAKAIVKYNELLAKGFTSDSLQRNLAHSYFKLDSTKQSEQLYLYLAQSTTARPSDYYYLAQSLKFQGKYSEADEWMHKYNQAVPSDSRGALQMNTASKVNELLEAKNYDIFTVPFNCENSDFGAVDFGDDVVFASARNNNLMIKRSYAWNEKPYLDLFTVKVSGDSISMPTSFSAKLNSIYHDGPLSFSANNSEVYFTRNNFYAYKVPKSGEDGVNNLKILYAKKISTGWSDVQELPFNSNSFSTGHPSISTTGDTLYFTSDRPGGLGNSDIYYVTRTANGWSEPVNMGAQINTEGDEMFPFIDAQGLLYFSSNGRLGLGGLDIFISKKDYDGNYVVKNLGAPINSSSDDFSFFLNRSGNQGFIASNRDGGVGDDDVYGFNVVTPISFNTKIILKGTVSEIVTQKPLLGSIITVLNPKGDTLTVINTKETNEFQFEVKPNEKLVLISSNETFFDKTTHLDVASVKPVAGVVTLPIVLENRPVELFWGLTGTVYLLPTNEVITKVEVSITPKNGGAERLLYTDSLNGGFKTKLAKDTEYDIVFHKKAFFTKRITFSTVGREAGYVNVNEFVDLSMKAAKLGASIEIKVLYDLGKSNIRPDAAQELNDMVKFLMDNPSISIELSSHTDSRGSDISNQALSQRRAESATAYIVSQGISATRITSVGYGEKRLKNKCDNGVKCSEEEHQQNRRTEVKITGI